MKIASVAEMRNRLSEHLARARRKKEPILITLYGKPYALVQPVSEADLETLDWAKLATDRLSDAWKDEDDHYYGYL